MILCPRTLHKVHTLDNGHRYIHDVMLGGVCVSLSLTLVIAKLFPRIHSELVSRATSLQHQSLYWGAAVVSNVFVYGLFLAAGRGWGYTAQIIFAPDVDDGFIKMNRTTLLMIIVPFIQEVIIHVILFVTAVRNCSVTNVPRPPRGVARLRGIVTGLIPSIALSAGSWYIKKTLEKAQDNPSTQSEYSGTDGAVNIMDSERVPLTLTNRVGF